MIDNINPISFQNPFLKKMVFMNSLCEFIESITDYANLHKLSTEEVIYFFTIDSMKKNYFFKYSSDITDYLIFNSFRWASMVEKRQRNRPKNLNDLIIKKRQRFFVNINMAFILSYNKYHIGKGTFDSIKYKIDLEKYLAFIYEISNIEHTK